MSGKTMTTRWWENYLVRYLMPSIAGVLIVLWLDQATDKTFSNLMPGYLLQNEGSLSSVKLTFFFLLGNLVCYVASFPVLVFHVTRALDNDEKAATATSFIKIFHSPHLISTIVALATWITIFFVYKYIAVVWLAVIVVVLFVSYQFYRLLRVICDRRGLKYQRKLARHKATIENSPDGKMNSEFRDSYWQMREHGNSAFILLLELIYCALLYVFISNCGASTFEKWGTIAVFNAVWVLPAVFVHAYGQYLESHL